ncbi:MAG TPA: FAD-dependent monooxygenase, partial [Candidatus Thalassarchaeaceae archaeon]|nr:FAD-dependent monooxygenase [Candidatus Thalassarchaeaceae archaeon]
EDCVEVTVSTPNGERKISCALLCGADGAHSWVRRKFRLGRPKEMMIGFQIEVTGYSGSDGRLDVYTGEDIAPGFFAWAIPSGETTRIGTWTRPDRINDGDCEDLLNTLLSKEIWKERFSDCREIGRYCGPIPSGMIANPLAERIAVFGDAAGLCKPTTGGGIGKGFEQVDLLVPQLVNAIRQGNLSTSRMKEISNELMPLRKKLNRSKALRDAFLTESSDDELDKVFAIWSRPEVILMIDEIGEIENPLPLGLRMLKEIPEFRKLTRKAAKALIWG